MTTTLVVTAAPGPTSFNRAWAQASIDAARALGHEVLTSDLYAMGFDPAERGAHYGIDGPFDPLKAQAEAPTPPDAAAEAEKVRAANNILFHFPIWWFSPPAILKGWTERVLLHGHLHDVPNRFDAGRLRGKVALFCVTGGAQETEVGPGGKEGRIELLLWPLAYTLRYCGMDIAAPVTTHGVHGYHRGDRKTALEARLAKLLAAQPDVIAGLPDRPRWAFHPDSDFDETGRLRDGIAPLSPFHG